MRQVVFQSDGFVFIFCLSSEPPGRIQHKLVIGSASIVDEEFIAKWVGRLTQDQKVWVLILTAGHV